MGKEEKEKASDILDKDEKDKDGKDDKKEEEPQGPVYTGEGFIPIQDLIDVVKAWQQRKVLCEEVDLLEAKGGRPESHLGTRWLLDNLKTDPDKGISTQSIESRKLAYGTNEIPRPPPAGSFKLTQASGSSFGNLCKTSLLSS